MKGHDSFSHPRAPVSIGLDAPTPRFLAGTAIATVLFHFIIWALVVRGHDVSWARLFALWDSGWYNAIVLNGYDGMNYAFYPLYPLLVRGVAAVTGLSETPQLAGALLSTLLLAGFVWGMIALLRRQGPVPTPGLRGLVPTTRFGWVLLMLSPASYVFTSHHTEALFLVLSLGAFVCCARGKWVPAALLAGLCALTKNQGVFLAVCVGLWSASQRGTLAAKAKVFVLSGLMSGALFALYPLYSQVHSGDFFAFAHAQEHWRAEISALSYFKTFWFGNPWQNTNSGSIQRHVFFFVMACAVPLVWRRHRWLGLYTGLFVGIMPLSGEFVGVFRYGTVLYPLWFSYGEAAAGRLPRWAKALIVLALLYLNHKLTRNFALERWPY